MQAQFLRNLLVGQIEPHQVQAQYPDFQWLVMAFKDTFGQVIKPLDAGVTVIPLSLFLPGVLAPFRHLSRPTLGTAYAVRPAEFAYFGIAFLIVDQVLDLEHRFALFVFRFALSLWICPSFRKLTQLLGIPIEPLFFYLLGDNRV